MPELQPEDRWLATKTALDETIIGDSGLENSLETLGIDKLPKGLVLDIGSGTRGAFQYEAAAKFPKTKVISISPNLIYKDYMFRQPEMEVGLNHHSINHRFLGAAAIAQMLPFKDKIFNMVVSHAAVPLFLPTDMVSYKAVFGEVLRVLKPKGVAVFAPMRFWHSQYCYQALIESGFNENQIAKEEIFVQNPVKDNSGNTWCRLGFQMS